MAYNADIVIALYLNNDDASFQISRECPFSSAFMEYLGLVRVLMMKNESCWEWSRVQPGDSPVYDFEDDSCMSISSTAI